MTAFLFALMLGAMLLGIPILLSIALVGYVGIAAPSLVGAAPYTDSAPRGQIDREEFLQRKIDLER